MFFCLFEFEFCVNSINVLIMACCPWIGLEVVAYIYIYIWFVVCINKTTEAGVDAFKKHKVLLLTFRFKYKDAKLSQMQLCTDAHARDTHTRAYACAFTRSHANTEKPAPLLL